VGIYLGRWFEQDETEAEAVKEVKETITMAPENNPV
jgi:hypothetical protein